MSINLTLSLLFVTLVLVTIYQSSVFFEYFSGGGGAAGQAVMAQMTARGQMDQWILADGQYPTDSHKETVNVFSPWAMKANPTTIQIEKPSAFPNSYFSWGDMIYRMYGEVPTFQTNSLKNRIRRAPQESIPNRAPKSQLGIYPASDDNIVKITETGIGVRPQFIAH